MIAAGFQGQTAMNNEDLAERQQHLLVRSAELRLHLTHQTQILKKPLAIADQAKAGVRWLCRNPHWPLATLLVLVVLRPRRTLVWGSRIWRVWNTVKRAKRWISGLPLPKIAQ